MSAIEFRVEVEADPAPVMHLFGEFDQTGLEVFDEALRTVFDLRSDTVVIDLGELAFIGSCGLGRLIRTNQVHPGVVLRNVRPPQRRLLELTNLDAVFRVEPSSETSSA